MSSQSQNYQRSPPNKSQPGGGLYPSQDSFGNDESALTSPRHRLTVHDQYTNIAANASPTKQKKSLYIQKEQKLRAKMLADETNQVHMLSGISQQHGPNNSDYSLSITKTKTDSSDSMFDHNDWTPQNSPYGGAFPLCGWIPKRIRQAIESMLLVVVGFGTIYFIVSVAIKLTGSGSSSSGSSSTYDELYDDHYVVAGNDDAEYVAYNVYDDDTDDFYTYDDNNNTNNDDTDDFYTL
jgi:hypothetical protein